VQHYKICGYSGKNAVIVVLLNSKKMKINKLFLTIQLAKNPYHSPGSGDCPGIDFNYK
jgi:hypothetical protein